MFAAFAGYAIWRCPVPGVGEPYYLTKARHFADPKWCARDLFLSSADTHRVFYQFAGPVACALTFEQTAWIGRILVWAALTWGWVVLMSVLIPGRFAAIGTAILFLALQATGNLAGEWLIGGVESKGLAYAALLLAIASACRGRWILVGAALGMSISLHPIVGIWGSAALFAAALPELPVAWRSPRGRRALFVGGAAAFICSLPGLLPALAALPKSPYAETARRADEIQVFDRLSHHLDPLTFAGRGYVLMGVLVVVWLALLVFQQQKPALRLFNRFVLASLTIAALGLAIGFTRLPALMKFYPFRLNDIFLPLAVAVSFWALLERLWPVFDSGEGRRRAGALAGRLGLLLVAVAWIFIAPGRIENPSRWGSSQWNEFVAACAWVREYTPPNSLIVTPSDNVGFKWYAQRAEYVTWKDVPQDAPAIVEWKARLDWLTDWEARAAADEGSLLPLTELREKTGADYVLSHVPLPRTDALLYVHGRFAVARLAPAEKPGR